MLNPSVLILCGLHINGNLAVESVERSAGHQTISTGNHLHYLHCTLMFKFPEVVTELGFSKRMVANDGQKELDFKASMAMQGDAGTDCLDLPWTVVQRTLRSRNQVNRY